MGKIGKVTISGTIIGLILSFSQPLYNLGILVFLGFGLFFLALKITTSKRGFEVKSFWLGYIAGLVYFLFYFKWFLLTDYPFFFVFLTWLLTAGALALPWGISATLFKKLDSKVSWTALLIFPAVFTVFEYLRSFLISLIWMGRQTPIGPHWTNGNLAYNLHQSWLALKVSSWVGIYGVTFIIIFLSLLLFLFLEKRKYKKLLVLIFGLVVLVYFPEKRFDLFGDPRSNLAETNLDQRQEVTIVQTKVPTQNSYTTAEEVSFFKNQLELVNMISKNYPQTNLVVFPEESNFFKTIPLFKNTIGASQYFYHLFPSSVLMIDNSQVNTDSSYQSKTIFLDSKKGVVDSYDKYLITPGAEYVPLLFRGIDKVLGLNSPVIKEVKEYQTGAKAPKKVLICADIFSPNLGRQASTTNILVAQSSFGFAKGPTDLLAQDLATSQFRAAENNRYLVKSSNFGRSFIISNQGKVEKIAPNQDWQILTGMVVLKENKTLYNRVGDAPILWASLMVVLVAIFFSKVRPF